MPPLPSSGNCPHLLRTRPALGLVSVVVDLRVIQLDNVLKTNYPEIGQPGASAGVYGRYLRFLK